MNTAVRTLQGYFADPRHAATMKWGSGGVFVSLLATLLWVAWVQGGARSPRRWDRRPQGRAWLRWRRRSARCPRYSYGGFPRAGKT